MDGIVMTTREVVDRWRRLRQAAASDSMKFAAEPAWTLRIARGAGSAWSGGRRELPLTTNARLELGVDVERVV